MAIAAAASRSFSGDGGLHLLVLDQPVLVLDAERIEKAPIIGR